MDRNPESDPERATSRAQLIEELRNIGPILTTGVTVNGRAILLESAIKLIERLPEGEYTISRKGLALRITPDPFASEAEPARPEEPTAPLVARLIERQHQRDAHEGDALPWWQRLRRFFGGR